MIPGVIGIIVAIGMIVTIITLRHHRHPITIANTIRRRHRTIPHGGMIALHGAMMTGPITPDLTHVGSRCLLTSSKLLSFPRWERRDLLNVD